MDRPLCICLCHLVETIDPVGVVVFPSQWRTRPRQVQAGNTQIQIQLRKISFRFQGQKSSRKIWVGNVRQVSRAWKPVIEFVEVISFVQCDNKFQQINWKVKRFCAKLRWIQMDSGNCLWVVLVDELDSLAGPGSQEWGRIGAEKVNWRQWEEAAKV